MATKRGWRLLSSPSANTHWWVWSRIKACSLDDPHEFVTRGLLAFLITACPIVHIKREQESLLSAVLSYVQRNMDSHLPPQLSAVYTCTDKHVVVQSTHTLAPHIHPRAQGRPLFEGVATITLIGEKREATSRGRRLNEGGV